jgi:hypothetical protein
MGFLLLLVLVLIHLTFNYAETLTVDFAIQGVTYQISLDPHKDNPADVAIDFCFKNAGKFKVTEKTVMTTCAEPVSGVLAEAIIRNEGDIRKDELTASDMDTSGEL